MSPSLASSRLASQPPSLEKPMFIIACKATWIRGSGWTAVAGGAEAGAAAPWSWVSFAEVVVFLGVDVVVLSSAGRVGYTGATSLSSTWIGISTASASGFLSESTVHSSSSDEEGAPSFAASGLAALSSLSSSAFSVLADGLTVVLCPPGDSTSTCTSMPRGSSAAATKSPTLCRYSSPLP